MLLVLHGECACVTQRRGSTKKCRQTRNDNHGTNIRLPRKMHQVFRPIKNKTFPWLLQVAASAFSVCPLRPKIGSSIVNIEHVLCNNQQWCLHGAIPPNQVRNASILMRRFGSWDRAISRWLDIAATRVPHGHLG